MYLCSPLAWAISDPTAPPGASEKAQTETQVAVKKARVPRLNAIFFNSSQPGAVIDQQFIQLGGSIKGYKLVSLKADYVTLSRSGKHYTLRMSNPSIIKVVP
ncbi:hypothetical protein DBZ36_01635 [Alginatibacterium sediminis]|uniref:MSHA biogenesis protein MshK n=2 Tax=Alginatibacterium sediminis TaxID=2164068 RepID=A0A420EL21_9ALTE|nr:hypothetical protein DBZ36_01635 [Alginatibacterium sediminis]